MIFAGGFGFFGLIFSFMFLIGGTEMFGGVVLMCDMFVDLYKKVYMIFRLYYEVDAIDKRFLYIELYNILEGVNPENYGHSKYRHSFYEIVNKVDFIEYIRVNNSEVKDMFNDIEMKVSKDLF